VFFFLPLKKPLLFFFGNSFRGAAVQIGATLSAFGGSYLLPPPLLTTIRPKKAQPSHSRPAAPFPSRDRPLLRVRFFVTTRCDSRDFVPSRSFVYCPLFRRHGAPLARPSFILRRVSFPLFTVGGDVESRAFSCCAFLSHQQPTRGGARSRPLLCVSYSFLLFSLRRTSLDAD